MSQPQSAKAAILEMLADAIQAAWKMKDWGHMASLCQRYQELSSSAECFTVRMDLNGRQFSRDRDADKAGDKRPSEVVVGCLVDTPESPAPPEVDQPRPEACDSAPHTAEEQRPSRSRGEVLQHQLLSVAYKAGLLNDPELLHAAQEFLAFYQFARAQIKGAPDSEPKSSSSSSDSVVDPPGFVEEGGASAQGGAQSCRPSPAGPLPKVPSAGEGGRN